MQIVDKGKWYIINVVSGYENRVKEELESRIISRNMTDYIFEVIIPRAKKYKVKDGKVKVSDERIYPGYLLVRMDMTNDSWYVVRNTDNVKGFVGTYEKGQKPQPLQQNEVDKIFNKMNTNMYDLKIGDTIKIINNKMLDGVVTEIKDINYEKEEIIIENELMGEVSKFTIPFDQITKK